MRTELRASEDDYNWQTYLYAAYLLGSGPNTSFKYMSVFQFPADNVRSDGLQVSDQQRYHLGSPIESVDGAGNPVFKINKSDAGIYWREFDNGVVMLYPHDVNVAGGMPDHASTKSLKGEVPADVWPNVPAELSRGEGSIALAAPPKTNVGRKIDFRRADAQALFSGNETMVAVSNGVQIKETSPAYLTDILLNPVKYRSHKGSLYIDLSLNNAKSPSLNKTAEGRSEPRKVVLVAEVDDDDVARPQRYTHAVFELLLGEVPSWSKATDPKGPRPLFRANSSSASNEGAETALLLRLPKAIQNMTALQRVSLSPQNALDAAGFTTVKFKRWDMVRFYGDYTLQYLQIGSDDTTDWVEGPTGY